MTATTPNVRLRHTQPHDFTGIVKLCQRVYTDTPPWSPEQLHSHLRVFPEGQFVAVVGPEQRVVSMAACCIVDWDQYHMLDSWETFTADGMFTKHDPVRGHTLYGAEIIVDPALQGHGIGGRLWGGRTGRWLSAGSCSGSAVGVACATITPMPAK